MGVRVAYGDKVNVSTAISNGVVPQDSIIIAKNGEKETELLFYDLELNLKSIVQTTRFTSEQAAVGYAAENDMVGRIVSVVREDGTIKVYVVQPDFTLVPIGNVTGDVPPASDSTLGGVKGSSEENGISVSEDGTMTVNQINVTKLTQEAGDEILFVCGSSAN